MAATVPNILTITAFVASTVFSVSLLLHLVPLLSQDFYGVGWGTSPLLNTEWRTFGCTAVLVASPSFICYFADVRSVFVRAPLGKTVEAVGRAEK